MRLVVADVGPAAVCTRKAGWLHTVATLSGVHEPPTVRAWLLGGPVDGAVRAVQCGPGGCPPALLLLGGGGRVFVGSDDEPVPPEYPIYVLEPEPVESMWPYRYVETLTS